MLEDAGYRALWVGQPLWNGVAILSRGAPLVETRRYLPGMENDDQARYLEAAVHGILVAALYLPNGNPIKGISTLDRQAAAHAAVPARVSVRSPTYLSSPQPP